MNKKTARLLPLLLTVLLMLPWNILAVNMQWSVHISHDLNGGQWGPNSPIPSLTIKAQVRKSMDDWALQAERSIKPVRESYALRGWSVSFTNVGSDGWPRSYKAL